VEGEGNRRFLEQMGGNDDGKCEVMGRDGNGCVKCANRMYYDVRIRKCV
jgi:hypothetical protein